MICLVPIAPKQVITKVVDANYLDSNYEYRFDPDEMAEPHSYLLVSSTTELAPN